VASSQATIKSLTPSASSDNTRLKKAVREFEALFVTQMLQEMRKTIPEDGALQGSSGPNKMYHDMLDEQLGYALSQGRGMGLAQALYRQLQQSAGHPPSRGQLSGGML
jgi:flagellar protein FlgJ